MQQGNLHGDCQPRGHGGTNDQSEESGNQAAKGRATRSAFAGHVLQRSLMVVLFTSHEHSTSLGAITGRDDAFFF